VGDPVATAPGSDTLLSRPCKSDSLLYLGFSKKLSDR
jgi:hypothetical protein